MKLPACPFPSAHLHACVCQVSSAWNALCAHLSFPILAPHSLSLENSYSTPRNKNNTEYNLSTCNVITALGYLEIRLYHNWDSPQPHKNNKYSNKCIPICPNVSLFVHTGQSLIHSDAEIKPAYGNILGIRKPSFKAVLKSLKKNLKILFWMLKEYFNHFAFLILKR